MTTHSPSTPSQTAGRGRATLTDRYVYAATRQLPEEQRADVAAELRASIGDRVDSLRASGNLSDARAEYAALEELGDPDRMAAGYTGKRLQLIGPELYPSYVRVMKALLVSVVPVVVIVIAVIEAIENSAAGSIIAKSVWVGIEVALQIAFWVTLTFAVVERTSSPEEMEESMGVEWAPDKLPDVPGGSDGSLSDAVASVVWLGFIAASIVWQQFRSPIQEGGERLPMLDPDLWSFWLPLILVLLVVEVCFELVRYRAGGWNPSLAAANTLLAAVFAAPFAYLAATDRLLNPAAVAEIQDGWSGFDPGTTNTIVIVAAVVIWVWDSIEGWRKTWSAQRDS